MRGQLVVLNTTTANADVLLMAEVLISGQWEVESVALATGARLLADGIHGLIDQVLNGVRRAVRKLRSGLIERLVEDASTCCPLHEIGKVTHVSPASGHSRVRTAMLVSRDTVTGQRVVSFADIVVSSTSAPSSQGKGSM